QISIGIGPEENRVRAGGGKRGVHENLLVTSRETDGAPEQLAVINQAAGIVEKREHFAGEQRARKRPAPAENIAESARDGVLRPRVHAAMRRRRDGDEAIAGIAEQMSE